MSFQKMNDSSSSHSELSSVPRQQITTTSDLPLTSAALFESKSSSSSSSFSGVGAPISNKPKTTQATVSARHKLSPKRAASQPPSKGRNRPFEPRESLQPSRNMPAARPPTVEDDEEDDDDHNNHMRSMTYGGDESIEDDDARDVLDSDEYATDDNGNPYPEIGISKGGSVTIDLTAPTSTKIPAETHPEKEDLGEVIVIESDPQGSSIVATNFPGDSNKVTTPSSQPAKNLKSSHQSHYEHPSNRIVVIEKYNRPKSNSQNYSHHFQENYCETVFQKYSDAKLSEFDDLVKIRNSTIPSRKRDFNAVDTDSIMYDPTHWTLQHGKLFPRAGWEKASPGTPTVKKFRTIPAKDRQSFLTFTPDAGFSGRRRRRSAKKSPEEEKHSSSRVGEQYQAVVPDSPAHARPYRNEEIQSFMTWDCKRAIEAEQRGEDIEGFMKKAEKYMHGSKGNFQAKDLNLTMRVMEALHKGDYCVKQALKEFVKMHHKDPVYSVDLSSQQESQFIELSHDLIGKKKDFSAAASIMGCRPEAVQVRYYQWKADQREEYTELKRERKKESDECEICGDGGRLIVCELCLKAFHRECLKPPLEELPESAWYCQRCTHSSPARLRRVHCTDICESDNETISARHLNLHEAQTLPQGGQKISSCDQSSNQGLQKKSPPSSVPMQRKVELLSVHKELSPHHNQNINLYFSTTSHASGAGPNRMSFAQRQGGAIVWSGSMLRQSPLQPRNPSLVQQKVHTDKDAFIGCSKSFESEASQASKVMQTKTSSNEVLSISSNGDDSSDSSFKAGEDESDDDIVGDGESKVSGKKKIIAQSQTEPAATNPIVVRRAIDRFTYETKLFFSPGGLLFINIGYMKKKKEVSFLGYTKNDQGQPSQAELSRSFHGRGDVFVSICGMSCTGKGIEEVKSMLRNLYNENPKREVVVVMKYADAQDTQAYAQTAQHNNQLPVGTTIGRNEPAASNSIRVNQASSSIHGNQHVFPTNAQGFFPQSTGRPIFSLPNQRPPQLGPRPVADVFLESTLKTMNLPNFILFLRHNNIHTTNAFLNADVLSLAKALSSANGFAESVAIDYICSIRMHLRQLMEKRFQR